MFKLLTETEKKKVLREYKSRRLAVILAAFSVVMAIGIVGLFPSYILSAAKKRDVAFRQELATEQSSPEDADLKSWLMDTNRTLTILSPNLDTDKPYEVLKMFVDNKTPGISIHNLSWLKTDKGTELKVSGIADSRQVLIDFENQINSSGQFTNVLLPVSNLAKDKDIDFEISVSPK